MKISPAVKIKKTITLFLIGFGGYFLYKNFSELSVVGQQINLEMFSLGIFFTILAIIINAYKLKLTIDISLNKKIFFGSWIQVFVKSYILNNVIPYSGLAYRGIYLKRYYDVSYTEYVGVIYLFGIVGLAFLLCSAALILSLHHHAIIFILIIMALFVLAKFKFYFFKKISNPNFKSVKMNFYLEKFGVLERLLRVILLSEKRYLFLFSFLFSLVIDFIVYCFIFISIVPEVPWHLLIYIYLSYSLAWLVRLTPGNIGIQEALIGGAASLLGIGLVNGVTISLLLRFSNLIGSFLLWALIARWNISK